MQTAWVEAVSAAQGRLLRLLDDRSTVIKTDNGVVVLDLQPLVVQLGDQIAIVNNISGRLPPGSTRITIMKADQLETAQKITHLLKVVGSFFWLVPLLLIAAAIWLARGRRRRILRQSAIGALIAGFLVLVIRKLAGSYVTSHLVASESLRPAVRNAWEIVTQLLADGAWTLIFVAAIALVGVWLAGETEERSCGATEARRATRAGRDCLRRGRRLRGLARLVGADPAGPPLVPRARCDGDSRSGRRGAQAPERPRGRRERRLLSAAAS